MTMDPKAGRAHFGLAAVLSAVAVGLGVGVGNETAWAHHDLRQGLTDLLGPNAWAIYLVVPVPYLLIGLLGYKIYRAVRASDPAQAEGAEDRRRRGQGGTRGR